MSRSSSPTRRNARATTISFHGKENASSLIRWSVPYRRCAAPLPGTMNTSIESDLAEGTTAARSVLASAARLHFQGQSRITFVRSDSSAHTSEPRSVPTAAARLLFDRQLITPEGDPLGNDGWQTSPPDETTEMHGTPFARGDTQGRSRLLRSRQSGRGHAGRSRLLRSRQSGRGHAGAVATLEEQAVRTRSRRGGRDSCGAGGQDDVSVVPVSPSKRCSLSGSNATSTRSPARTVRSGLARTFTRASPISNVRNWSDPSGSWM